MLSSARLYTSASSAAVRTSRFEGIAMAIKFHQYKTLMQSEENISSNAEGTK